MRCCVIFFMGNSLSDLKTRLIPFFGNFGLKCPSGGAGKTGDGGWKWRQRYWFEGQIKIPLAECNLWIDNGALRMKQGRMSFASRG
jgi:hypothetical protein